MGYFLYTGQQADGTVVRGTLQASERLAAARRLRSEGILPYSVRPVPALLAEAGAALRRAPSGRELGILWRHLGQMLRAGMPLVSALRLKEQDRSHPGLRDVLAAVRTEVEGGAGFAAALRRRGAGIPAIAVEMIAAGEAGGSLEAVLERLADQSDREETARGRLRSALTYPTLVLCLSLAVVAFMVTYILPQFAGIFAELERPLPLALQLLAGVGALVRRRFLITALGTGLMVLLVRHFVQTDQGRRLLDEAIFRLPVLGSAARRRAAARGVRVLAGLVASGVPVTDALVLTERTVGNVVLRSATARVRAAVERGQDLATAFRQAGEYPDLVPEFVTIGQESGAVPDMLQRAATWLDDDVTRMVERLTALLEPLIMMAITAFVGGVVVAIMLPIMDLWQVTP